MITSLEIMIFEPRTTPATIIHIQIRHHDLLKKKKKKKHYNSCSYTNKKVLEINEGRI